MSAAPMKPILFSAPMIRAILSGRKTQTRRIVKPQPAGLGPSHWYQHPTDRWWTCGDNTGTTWVCPYGVPGDRLWVRETFCLESSREVGDYPPPFSDGRPIKYHNDDGDGAWWQQPHYRATDPTPELDIGKDEPGVIWRPSIFMPRWASRITLEVTEVRVQRVQEISEDDAIAEGMLYHDGGGIGHSGWRHDIDYGCVYNTAREAFMAVWDCINSSRGFGWQANPWCWAISFRRVD